MLSQARNALRVATEDRERINTQLQGVMSLRDAELAEDEEYDGGRSRTPPQAGGAARPTRRQLERGNMELRRRITQEKLALGDLQAP